MTTQMGYAQDNEKYGKQVHRSNHSVVKENGCYLHGNALDEVIDAVEHDRTECTVDGYTIHILEHEVDESGNKVTLVKVEGLD